jgi:hypothetical protein
MSPYTYKEWLLVREAAINEACLRARTKKHDNSWMNKALLCGSSLVVVAVVLI